MSCQAAMQQVTLRSPRLISTYRKWNANPLMRPTVGVVSNDPDTLCSTGEMVDGLKKASLHVLRLTQHFWAEITGTVCNVAVTVQDDRGPEGAVERFYKVHI